MRSVQKIAAIGSFAGFCVIAFPALAQFVPPQAPPVYGNPHAQQQVAPNTRPPQPLGARCSTPSGVCVMGGAGPLGAGCTCAVPGGYIPGRIIQ
jgi:hypothetical protein